MSKWYVVMKAQASSSQTIESQFFCTSKHKYPTQHEMETWKKMSVYYPTVIITFMQRLMR